MHETGFDHFDRLSRVCQTTRDILVRHLAGAGGDQVTMAFLSSESLAYVERAEQGMHLLARADGYTRAESTALVQAAGISAPPWPGSPDGVAALIERGSARLRRSLKVRRADPEELEAFGHVQLILALIPRSPLVSWPIGPTSYADVPVPRSAGELALRVEELERSLWWVASGRSWQGPDLRRTFAFFETATSLTINGFGSFGPS